MGFGEIWATTRKLILRIVFEVSAMKVPSARRLIAPSW